MRAEWPLRTIAECAANEPHSTQIGPFGKALTPDEYTQSGVPLLRGVNVNKGRFHDDDFVFISEAAADRLAKFESFPDDVLLVHKGTLGKIGLMPKHRRFHRYIMGNSMLRVRCNPKILVPEYLYYWLGSAAGTNYLLSRVSQVGVPQIQHPLTTLRECRLPVPPLGAQHTIAHILGTLDDKIELNRRMNHTLEAMALALFKSWFVDPTQKGLPQGWRNSPVSELCEINSWTLAKGDNLEHIEYVEISEVSRGNIADIQLYERGTEPSRARRRLRHGDSVLSTVRPDRGSYFLCLHPSPNLIASTGFAVLTPRKAPWSFIHAAMTQDEVFDYLGKHADGGAYPAIRPDIIGTLEVPLPPQPEILESFHRVCAPLYERAEHNRRESRTLALLRDTLLPKLLSGALQIKDGVKICRVMLFPARAPGTTQLANKT
jgi:type I restriction enzyme, S subunit